MLEKATKVPAHTMLKSFDNSLADLKGLTVEVEPGNGYPEEGQCSIRIQFSNGAVLSAEFWRVVEGDRAGVSSFDHEQKYGLPAPINALSALQKVLQGKVIVNVRLDRPTGDLFFGFMGDTSVQVFNFTGYEIWEMLRRRHRRILELRQVTTSN